MAGEQEQPQHKGSRKPERNSSNKVLTKLFFFKPTFFQSGKLICVLRFLSKLPALAKEHL